MAPLDLGGSSVDVWLGNMVAGSRWFTATDQEAWDGAA